MDRCMHACMHVIMYNVRTYIHTCSFAEMRERERAGEREQHLLETIQISIDAAQCVRLYRKVF